MRRLHEREEAIPREYATVMRSLADARRKAEALAHIIADVEQAVEEQDPKNPKAVERVWEGLSNNVGDLRISLLMAGKALGMGTYEFERAPLGTGKRPSR